MKKTALTLAIFALCVTSAFAQSMDWLCHPGKYSQIQYVGRDIFKVKTPQGKWGLMHASGDMRVDARYDSISSFVENRALLLDKAGKRLLGIVDPEGNIVKDFSLDEIYVSKYPNFKEGRLAFGRRDGLYGYMNDQGTTVIEPQYYMAAPFQDGVAAVQYEDTDYGLVNKAGRSVIVANEHYPFISSPVNGKVLVIKGSRRGGDQLVIMRIQGTDLKKEKVLEDGMNIWLSDDFTTIECQLGHTYTLDDQWRVVSSGHGASLPQVSPDLPAYVVSDNSTVLGKVAAQGGMKITYLGNPIMDFTFPDVATFDKSYAVVRSKDGKVGVLKLNPSASITIEPVKSPLVFNHNEMKDVVFDVKLVDLDPTKIKWYRNDQGALTRSTLEQVNGLWKLRMPYFKAADSYDNETVETVDIAITYDGLDWMHQFVEVGSRHMPDYAVSITGSDFTSENGNLTLNLTVASNSSKSAKATITIAGIKKDVPFSGGSKTIPLTVSVPEGGSKTFTYTVEVEEEGCPTYSTKVTKHVSNPGKKRKSSAKKDIIIQ